jgi:hypothetical protein
MTILELLRMGKHMVGESCFKSHAYAEADGPMDWCDHIEQHVVLMPISVCHMSS